MGLGRRTFAPGEVLTASNVMNYLQDQAVMSFAGTAARGSAIGTAVQEGMVSYLQDTNFLQVRDDNAWHSIAGVQAVASATVRDSLIPTPNQGDKVFRSDLGYEQTYYAAWGTANPGGRASAGWYDNQRNMGLVPIVPPTVNISGGTATANTLGTVSFSAITSISFNNVFTSAYKNYKINIRLDSATAASDVNFRARVGGSDDSSNNYYRAGSLATSAGALSANSGQTTAQIIGVVANSTSAHYATTIDLFSPQEAKFTSALIQSQSWAGSSTTVYCFNWAGFMPATTTQYDGFSFYPNSGNLTGNITIYGYNS